MKSPLPVSTTIPESPPHPPPRRNNNNNNMGRDFPDAATCSTLLLSDKSNRSTFSSDASPLERNNSDKASSTLVSSDSKTAKVKSPEEENSGDHWQPLPWSSSPKKAAGITSKTIQLHPSPTNGWPQRSPMKSDHDHDVASFTLFTQSFDTLSETGHYLRDLGSSSTPTKTRPPRKIDFEESLSQVGDISPIKLDDPHHHPSQHPARSLYHNEASLATTAHHGYHHNHSHPSPHEYGEMYQQPPMANPLYVLRSAHRAFGGCTYVLPCVDNRDICPVNLGPMSSFKLCGDENAIPAPRDVAIATQRVEAVICAFGGYIKPRLPVASQHDSIFRLKRKHQKSPSKQFYDDTFHQRYLVTANHISWELEEKPPVGEPTVSTSHSSGGTPNSSGPRAKFSQSQGGSHDSSAASFGVPVDCQQQKMKYRCKLCGQLKQNHDCPYQQSLQRSIAVMVYPAVNAFTASEPGILTKSLSEMNNFVSYDSNIFSDSGYSCAPTTREKKHHHVTPETSKCRDNITSPQSSLSTTHSSNPSTEMDRKMSPKYNDYSYQAPTPVSGEKRPQGLQDDYARPSKKPFVRTLALRPEHYRAVTPRIDKMDNELSYSYPHVALTFRERKRLSDTLFFLSRQMPDMAIHVASLLRIAREKDEWDLSVAELLVQVVVGLYCREGDHQLEGLQHYLLRLGISC